MKFNKRLIVKGFIWELLALLTIYLLTFDLSVGLWYITIRLVSYYIYHEMWHYGYLKDWLKVKK